MVMSQTQLLEIFKNDIIRDVRSDAVPILYVNDTITILKFKWEDGLDA